MGICKCTNNKCTLKAECLRATMKSNKYRQAEAEFKQKDGDCDHFIKNDKIIK